MSNDVRRQVAGAIDGMPFHAVVEKLVVLHHFRSLRDICEVLREKIVDALTLVPRFDDANVYPDGLTFAERRYVEVFSPFGDSPVAAAMLDLGWSVRRCQHEMSRTLRAVVDLDLASLGRFELIDLDLSVRAIEARGYAFDRVMHDLDKISLWTRDGQMFRYGLYLGMKAGVEAVDPQSEAELRNGADVLARILGAYDPLERPNFQKWKTIDPVMLAGTVPDTEART